MKLAEALAEALGDSAKHMRRLQTLFTEASRKHLQENHRGTGLVTVCSRTTNVIMVGAWMLWLPYALEPRTLLWFMGALVTVCKYVCTCINIYINSHMYVCVCTYVYCIYASKTQEA